MRSRFHEDPQKNLTIAYSLATLKLQTLLLAHSTGFFSRRAKRQYEKCKPSFNCRRSSSSEFSYVVINSQTVSLTFGGIDRSFGAGGRPGTSRQYPGEPKF